MALCADVVNLFVLICGVHRAFGQSIALAQQCEHVDDCIEGISLQLIQTKLQHVSSATMQTSTIGLQLPSSLEPSQAGTFVWPLARVQHGTLALLVILVAMLSPCFPEQEVAVANDTGAKEVQSLPAALANKDVPEVTKFEPKAFQAVNSLRLLGAIHIVFLHYGPDSTLLFNRLGISWVSLFFAVSGMGTAYSKLQKKQSESRFLPVPRTLFRRWAGVYPLYIFALACAFVLLTFGSKHRPIDVSMLVKELLMVPRTLHCSKMMEPRYNFPDWLCTVLLVCWIFEEACFQIADACWRRGA
jgi:hypothetical protein